jgi:hypothetical protein
MDMSVYIFPYTSLDVIQNPDKGQSCGLGRSGDLYTKAQSLLSGKALASGCRSIIHFVILLLANRERASRSAKNNLYDYIHGR